MFSDEQQCTEQNGCDKNKDSLSSTTSSTNRKLKLKVTQHRVGSSQQKSDSSYSKNCNDCNTPKMKSDVSKMCSKRNPPSSSSCSVKRE